MIQGTHNKNTAMSNSARDLLNYVDDHKQEMKEGVYKSIVDKLVPINKELEQNKKTKYNVFFLVTEIRRDINDESLCEADYKIKFVELYLSKTDVDFINNHLDKYGQLNQIWENDYKDSQGLQTVETVRRIFCKSFETTTISCDISDDNDEIEWKDTKIIYSNNVVITRIKKM